MPDFKVDLTGQNALVAGAGAGYGRAIAFALAASGAAVAVNDLNIERAETVAERIQCAGGRAIAVHADISNRFQTANMIEQTRDAFGGIQILVNAAGAFKAEAMLEIDEWDWRRQIEVNLTGTFFCMQLVGRVMADEGGGKIINLSSVAAQQGSVPRGIGFIAGKAGVIGLTRQAARELAPHQIRVNAIAVRYHFGGEADSEADAAEDIADAALFLCSDAADSITGQVIAANGGASIRS